MQVDCINAEELVDVTYVTVGQIVIEVGVYSSSVYGAVFRALNPPGSCWTTLDEAVNEVAPPPDTYPMLIAAEAVPNGVPVSIQIAFTVNGLTKWTPYAESLLAGSYTIVFPPTITLNGTTYTLLGTNEFTISHPQNAESYFKASYFAELPPPNGDTLIETYRGIDIMQDAVTANLYFHYEGLRYEFSSNTPIETVRARIDELLYEPPPNGDGWPVTKSIHLFDNMLLKAEWYDINKILSRSIRNIDTAVLLGGRLDYTVTYTQGLPIAEDARIAIDGLNIVSEALSKGQSKSGSIDLTGLIGSEATVTISFPSSPGIWSEVMFDIWITLGYSEEPSVNPSITPPDWTKWLIWGAVGIGALLILTRGPKVIVVKG